MQLGFSFYLAPMYDLGPSSMPDLDPRTIDDLGPSSIEYLRIGYSSLTPLMT